MNLQQLNELLIQRIQRFGASARENRQVHARLIQLLPDRLQGIASSLRSEGLGASESMRLAYVHDEYLKHVDELIQVAATSFESRVQYETHMMLFEARRTLRAFRR